MPRPLQSYHYVWLSVHPGRDEAWLRDILAKGFAIHHMDGNHDNDASDNLVLIEQADHMFLHGMNRLKFTGNKSGPRKTKISKQQKLAMRIEKAMRIYAKPLPPSLIKGASK